MQQSFDHLSMGVQANAYSAQKTDNPTKDSVDDTNKENIDPNVPNQAYMSPKVQKRLLLFPRASFKTPKNKKTILSRIMMQNTALEMDDRMPTEAEKKVVNKYKRRRCNCGSPNQNPPGSVGSCDLCMLSKKKLMFN